MKKLAAQQIVRPPHPWPLSPKVVARGKKKIELTPSPPLGERVAEGRVRGVIQFLHTFRGPGGGRKSQGTNPLESPLTKGDTREAAAESIHSQLHGDTYQAALKSIFSHLQGLGVRECGSEWKSCQFNKYCHHYRRKQFNGATGGFLRLRLFAFLPSFFGLVCLLTAGGCNRLQSSGETTKKKVLLLGVDGMDPQILERLIQEGKMPNFQLLKNRGGFKPLRTSTPPQSPVAWSDLITGMNPGGHGIFDFIHRDPNTLLPYFSTSRTEPAKKTLAVGDWVLPLSSGKVHLLRQGKSFWEVLKAHGVPATIFRIPSNFPPVKSQVVQLSGMGTPDIRGTYGIFSFYTDEAVDKYAGISGGEVFPVKRVQQQIHAKLSGPSNSFRKGSPQSSVEFTVIVDAENPVAKIVLQDQQILLREKEWSDWVKVKFEVIPFLQSVGGICRFYLKELRPNFKLYVTPINIDPASPALPISTPEEYSQELCDHVGPFYTQGIPEDTKALSAGVLNDTEFLQQAKLVFDEQMALFDYELNRFREGLLFLYVGRIDQLAHMFWRNMDASHPAHESTSPHAHVIEESYREIDDILGKVFKSIEDNTTLIVLSDHGFAPFYRAFSLNTWLRNNAYASLLDFSEGGLLQNVDWNHTRAYGLGFNGLYVNLKGRERNGIVQPGSERAALLKELTEKLLSLQDPKTGQPVVLTVHRAEEIYTGPLAKDAPDLIIGYNRGYRASWETTLGKFPRQLLRDNNEKWSGDHLISADLVPGVLLSNKKINVEHPSLHDIAPTVLSLFSITKEAGMIGNSIFYTERQKSHR